jgi:2-polyprenyl-3-methyl-5-hydroxy-6-metoxy-1,4-benzoquinol methylase
VDTAKIRQDFDTIATLADRNGSGSDRHDAFLCSLVPAQARTIVDVGCGTGRLAQKLVNQERHVLGIDLSPVMIERAQRYSDEKSGIEFISGDFLSDHRLDCMFDCVVTATTLHHVPLDIGIRRLKEITRPGGILILHDMRNTVGAADLCKAYIALAEQALKRFVRTGSPFTPAAVRRAWKQHGAGEDYLSMPEIRNMVRTCLPGARIYQHWAWRYTVVWRNQENQVKSQNNTNNS